MNTIISAEDDYPIQPKHIDASQHLCGAFDNMETEVSAGWLVRFTQERGTSWAPFTQDEINGFYGRKHSDGFTFNRLVNPEDVFAKPAEEFGRMLQHASFMRGAEVSEAVVSYALNRSANPPETVQKGGGWIVLRDGKYHFTHDFIVRCFKSSPASNDKLVEA